MNLAHLSDQEIKETLVLKERLELLKKRQGFSLKVALFEHL